MKIAALAGLGALALGLSGQGADAQSRNEILQRFTGQMLSVVEYRDLTTPSGFTMRVEFRDGNLARFHTEGEEYWASWRVPGRGAICTTVSIAVEATLVAIEDEKCLGVTFNGDRVQLDFVEASGDTVYYVGTLSPL